MPTTLPGGLWYPERHAVATVGAGMVVASGDAAGAQFSFDGPLSVRGATLLMRFDTTGDFTLALTALDGTVLRSTAWPGTLTPHSVFQYWAPLVTWDPYELTAGTTYRLIATVTGTGTATVAYIAPHSTPGLGIAVRRVAGVWTTEPTRRPNAALHIGGF